jgi:hypothetical protein
VNIKKVGGLFLLIGTILSLFFRERPPKLYCGIPEYYPISSDDEYVEVDVTDQEPDFTHPTSKMKHPSFGGHYGNEYDDNDVRFTDGSA